MNLIFFQEPDKNHGISFRIVSFKLRSQSPVVTMIHSSLTLSLYCEGLSIRGQQFTEIMEVIKSTLLSYLRPIRALEDVMSKQ